MDKKRREQSDKRKKWKRRRERVSQPAIWVDVKSKKCTPLSREARSTFRSQNVKSEPFSERSWKLRCCKSYWRGGAKRILKSNCEKRTTFAPPLEVEMSKKGTLLRPCGLKHNSKWTISKTDGLLPPSTLHYNTLDYNYH